MSHQQQRAGHLPGQALLAGKSIDPQIPANSGTPILMHVSDTWAFPRHVQIDFRARLRDFCVRIILTFVPHEMEKSQAGKAGGKKHPSRREAFGAALPVLCFVPST